MEIDKEEPQVPAQPAAKTKKVVQELIPERQEPL